MIVIFFILRVAYKVATYFCLVFLRLVYPMLPVSLDCPLFFLLPLRYSLTFIYIIFCNRQEINEHNAFDSCALDICLRHHIVPLV